MDSLKLWARNGRRCVRPWSWVSLSTRDGRWKDPTDEFLLFAVQSGLLVTVG